MISSLMIGAGLMGLVGLVQTAGPSDKPHVVFIARGATLATISQQLSDAKLVSSPRLFRLTARFAGLAGQLRAGEFGVPPGLSLLELARHLATATPKQRFLTIPEGATAVEVMAVLEATPGLTDIDQLALEEGAVLPETYAYGFGDSALSLAARMQRDMNQLLVDLWEARAPNLPFTGPEEALILASIVEKETGVAGERAQVASVFINRLRAGMRLQSDPTVIYGVTGGEVFGRAITRADLKASTPYNTYRIDGLPPGPIASPGRASLEAVFNPAETDYLYFVADGSGGHVFARTLKEHNRNVARWRKLRAQQR